MGHRYLHDLAGWGEAVDVDEAGPIARPLTTKASATLIDRVDGELRFTQTLETTDLFCPVKVPRQRIETSERSGSGQVRGDHRWSRLEVKLKWSTGDSGVDARIADGTFVIALALSRNNVIWWDQLRLRSYGKKQRDLSRVRFLLADDVRDYIEERDPDPMLRFDAAYLPYDYFETRQGILTAAMADIDLPVTYDPPGLRRPQRHRPPESAAFIYGVCLEDVNKVAMEVAQSSQISQFLKHLLGSRTLERSDEAGWMPYSERGLSSERVGVHTDAMPRGPSPASDPRIMKAASEALAGPFDVSRYHPLRPEDDTSWLSRPVAELAVLRYASNIGRDHDRYVERDKRAINERQRDEEPEQLDRGRHEAEQERNEKIELAAGAVELADSLLDGGESAWDALTTWLNGRSTGAELSSLVAPLAQRLVTRLKATRRPEDASHVREVMIDFGLSLRGRDSWSRSRSVFDSVLKEEADRDPEVRNDVAIIRKALARR